ncbi:ParB N-terminal domain-containing protein [Jannaschia sp. M317]|uniref:ParB/RepB/Spo0J family partition protein n=1 Tax=Jannaschia sp. M317 TaxID=2867011 RepID=UPI0021A4843D|nr:ParB N-terminal domain-containing protein [Jannaschia sp. M317]UWQ19637.1 ParB N-terminal domain-containing protein [Jannaschia sp. M317]
MAKRKRLTPLQQPAETKDAGLPPAPPTGLAQGLSRAPVAQVAGDAAQASAAEEMAAHMAEARAQGLLLVTLPLGRIDLTHLHRDRILPADLTADEDMAALITSIRARGQQVPVDVVRLTGDPRERYGLISGMRRMTALRHLFDETGDDRFGRVTARVVTPENAPDAYLTMVEENEIRADISYWERARIALKAVEAGAYPDRQAALRGLYGNVSRAKRSKIGSFIGLVAALDGHLRYPTALPERRGLALAKALDDQDVITKIREQLAASPPNSAEAEQALLDRALKTPAPARPAPAPVDVARDGDRLILSGPGLDGDFQRDLTAWLRKRASSK